MIVAVAEVPASKVSTVPIVKFGVIPSTPGSPLSPFKSTEEVPLADVIVKIVPSQE